MMIHSDDQTTEVDIPFANVLNRGIESMNSVIVPIIIWWWWQGHRERFARR